MSITTQLALFLVGQEAIRRRCEGAMKKQKRVWAEQLPQRDATCEDSAIGLDLIEVSSRDISMMSQPGFGIGCSTAFAKLPLRSASDDEASARKIREVSLCVLVFTGLLHSQYFRDGLRQHVMTLVWLLVGAAYLWPQTSNWLVSCSPKIYACLTPLPPFFALFVDLSLSTGEFKHGILFVDSPGHMLFRAFIQGAGNAALCGELRLQIASSVALHVGIVAICWYRWQIQSSVGSGGLSGIPMWLSLTVFVVQWLGLLGTHLLIWKVLRPLSLSMALGRALQPNDRWTDQMDTI